MARERHRKVWAQRVVVTAAALEGRLAAIEAAAGTDVDPVRAARAQGVRHLLETARRAALGLDPRPGRLSNWWRGTLIESAFQNLHAAKAELALLMSPNELQAEVPDAIARIESGLAPDDPRRTQAQSLGGAAGQPVDAVALRKVLEQGYAAADQMHTRVRNFRNIVLVAALLTAVVVGAFCLVIAGHPNAVPLCFRAQDPGGQICPTSEGTGGPSGGDVLVVALLGVIGGAVAAAISIRSLRGTSTPYDVPLALTLLKVPTGALTAIAALIAIRGEFIPGLSALDSQEQILAYALAFGYSQQLLTGMVDQRAESILSTLPSKDPQAPRRLSVPTPPVAGAPSAVSPVEHRQVVAGHAMVGASSNGSSSATASWEFELDPDAQAWAMSDLDVEIDDSDVPEFEPRDVADAGVLDDSEPLLTVADLEGLAQLQDFDQGADGGTEASDPALLEVPDQSDDDPAPMDAAPMDVAPSDGTPTDATPTDATPTDATPTDATPTDATPTETTPTPAGGSR